MQSRPYTAEDEIDLRDVVRTLWRHRWVIGGITTAAALVAAVVSVFILPPVYESRVLLMVTRPPVQTVDPSSPAFRSGELNIAAILNPELPGEAVVALARSPAVRDEVARRIGVPKTKLKSLQAQSVRNTNLVELRVRYADPHEARRIATAWAEVVVGRSSVLFSTQAQGSYALFNAQLEVALNRLKRAEQALRHFNATSRISELQTRLGKLIDQLASYEVRRNDLTISLNRAENELAAIEGQLRREPRTYALSKSITNDPFLHEAMATASNRGFLELSKIRMRTEEQNPVYNALSQARATAAVAVQALRAEKSTVERAMEAIQQEVAVLRTELATQILTQTRLARELENAKRVYDAVFQRREAARITATTRGGTVQVALPASLPDEPVSPRPALNAAIAAVLGFMFSTVGVLIRSAWITPAELPRVQTAASAEGDP